MNTEIYVIAHDIRSTHNVGALFRLCDGMGVHELFITGYTPFPAHQSDSRLPHSAKKISTQIHKTALGAEHSLPWSVQPDIIELIRTLKQDGVDVIALEQAEASIKLNTYKPPKKMALLLGREVDGLDPKLLNLCDKALEIPMLGSKESHNVVQAAAMALYHCRFST